ncbi:MAG: diacylglycerol kinase family protein [Acidimicrobiia bacterium]
MRFSRRLIGVVGGGVVIGAATYRATRRAASAVDGHVAVAHRCGGPVIDDGRDLSIVVNPSAGSEDNDDTVAMLRREFPAARLLVVGDGLTLDHALSESLTTSVLGIVGGDGSINAAAEVALDSGRPLAVVPGGTLNHFARDVGLADGSDVVEALRSGDVVAVDVGVIGGRPFLNTASFGSYADFVDAREALEGRLGKRVAAVVAAAQVLWQADPIGVELDGAHRRIWMIFVGNCEYEPPGFAPIHRPRLDDGTFDVRYIDGTERWSRARFLGALLTGRLESSPVFHRSLVRSIDVHSSNGPLRLARDGETFDGEADVTVEKHSARLGVYVPCGPEPTVSPRPPA